MTQQARNEPKGTSNANPKTQLRKKVKKNDVRNIVGEET